MTRSTSSTTPYAYAAFRDLPYAEASLRSWAEAAALGTQEMPLWVLEADQVGRAQMSANEARSEAQWGDSQ